MPVANIEVNETLVGKERGLSMLADLKFQCIT